MSQSDMVIADQPGASFLADLNSVISALATNSSGATEPATTYAYQLWADSTAALLKQRNAANDGWVTVWNLTTGAPGSGVAAGPITASGLTQATARMLGRSTAGTGAVEEITLGSGLSLLAGVLDLSIPRIQGATIATTSGAAIDLTGVPASAGRVVLVYNALSTDGVNSPIVQLGSTTFKTSGYVSDSAALQDNVNVSSFNFGNGFGILSGSSMNAVSGALFLNHIGGNTWVAFGVFRRANTSLVISAGVVTLAGVLDRIRFTTFSGSDVHDGGSVTPFFE